MIAVIIGLVLFFILISFIKVERLPKEKGYVYFNENGEGIPIQRHHLATDRIQTRYVVDYDGDYSKCEWYDSDINGKPLE